MRFARPALVVVLAFVLFVSACGDSGDDGSADDGGGTTTTLDPQTGGQVVYGIETDPIGMDPTKQGWDASGLMVANAVFDPLMAYDADGVPQPYLLESLDHNDGFTVWNGKLRSGVKFHDGTPLTAQSVSELYAGHLESLLTGPAAWPITEIVATGELTLEVRTSEPWATLPNIMAAQGGMVAAPSQLADPNGATKPVGTGPFKLKEWVEGERIVVERNPDYWREGMPYLDEVVFVPEPDPKARVDKLTSGDFDMIHMSFEQGFAQMEQAADAGEIKIVIDEGEADESMVMFNMQSAPLDDIRVRRAAVLAIDREAQLELTGVDPARAADSPFTKESIWYTDTDFPDYDPEEAKRLVDEYEAEKGPIQFTLSLVPVAQRLEEAQAMVDSWEEAGMEVEVVTVEQRNFIIEAAVGNYDAMLFRLFSAPDPDGDWYWWHSRNTKPNGEISLNFARFSDPEIDDALITGRQTQDQATRQEAYATVQQRFTDLLPYLWLHHIQWSIGARTDIYGIENGPLPNGEPALPMLAGWNRLTQTYRR